MSRLVACCLLVLSATAAVGQSSPPATLRSFDLEAAVRRAIEHYPGLHIAQKDTEMVARQLDEARHSHFLPRFEMLNFFGPVPDVPDGTGPPNFPRFNERLDNLGIFYRLELAAVQPLYTFGRLKNAVKLAEAGHQAKLEEERSQLHELVFNVKRAYYGLAALEVIDGFLAEIDEKLEKVRARIQKELKKGASEITESDRLKVEVFAAEIGKRQLQAAEMREQLNLALALLLGFDGDLQGWRLEVKPLKKVRIEKISVQTAVALAKEGNAKIKQLNHLVDIKRRLLNIAQAELLPTFFLGGFLKYTVAPEREDVDNPFLVDEFNNLTGGVALGMRQSLNFHIQNDRRRREKAAFEKALFQKRLAESAVIVDVRTKYIQMEKAAAAYAVSSKGFRAARSWLAAEMNNMMFGLTPVDDAIDAFGAYAKTRFDFVDATLKYDVAVAELTKVLYRELSNLQYPGDGRQTAPPRS